MWGNFSKALFQLPASYLLLFFISLVIFPFPANFPFSFFSACLHPHFLFATGEKALMCKERCIGFSSNCRCVKMTLQMGVLRLSCQ